MVVQQSKLWGWGLRVETADRTLDSLPLASKLPPRRRMDQAMGAAVRGFSAAKYAHPWFGPAAALLTVATVTTALHHPLPRHPVAAVLRHLGMEQTPVPQRADILDRHGVLLAHSVMVPSLYADPSRIADPAAAATALAAVLPGLDAKALAARLASPKRFVWIARQITPAQMQAVNALSLAGLGYRDEERRQYPLGAETAHVVGYADVDHAGIAGIEAAADPQLSQSHAPLRLTVDTRRQAAVHAALQAAMEEAGAAEGAAIVMDAHTGEITALVSLPDFDPAQAALAAPIARFNWATQAMLELDDFYGPFRDALTRERNLAPDSNLPAGIEQDFMRRLGLLDRAALDFPEQGAPLTPDSKAAIPDFQHHLAVSGVQLAAAYSALVNGGTLPHPTLIERHQSAWMPKVITGQTSAAMRAELASATASLSDQPQQRGRVAAALAAVPAGDPHYVVFARLGTNDTDQPNGEALRGRVAQLASQLAADGE